MFARIPGTLVIDVAVGEASVFLLIKLLLLPIWLPFKILEELAEHSARRHRYRRPAPRASANCPGVRQGSPAQQQLPREQSAVQCLQAQHVSRHGLSPRRRRGYVLVVTLTALAARSHHQLVRGAEAGSLVGTRWIFRSG